jgi:ABC-type molybdate transport system substrate-binding protein
VGVIADLGCVVTTPATIRLYAAGSLRAALGDVAKAFEASSGHSVQAKYGPSGLLREEIVGGAPAHVFASANMKHPQALAETGQWGPVRMFARNRLCALIRPGLDVNSDSLLARLLDPHIKVGTSTPTADPSGDYAFEVFVKADAIRPDTKVVLETKAIKLTGGRDSAKPPEGRNVYGWHIAEGRADIFLTYRTNAIEAQRQNPTQQIVMLPAGLVVGADYGLTVANNAPPAAHSLTQFILSAEGQKILAAHGFAPPG